MSVTVTAMQPYLFPYLGYFQLIAHGDLFVVGDDYPWVRSGWINRNRYLDRDGVTTFTLPLVAAPGTTPINERRLADAYPAYRRGLLARLRHAYARSPRSREVLPLVEEWLLPDEHHLLTVLLHALRGVCAHLEIGTEWALSSARPDDEHRGAERVVRLVEAFGGTRFLNPPGGREIYRRAQFAARGIDLAFLDPDLPHYPQRDPVAPFVPALSILDVLMNNPREQVREMVLLGRESPGR